MLAFSVMPHRAKTLQDMAYKAYVRKNTMRFSHLKRFAVFDEKHHLNLIAEVIQELWPSALISKVSSNTLFVVR